jgi:hypothetical protein
MCKASVIYTQPDFKGIWETRLNETDNCQQCGCCWLSVSSHNEKTPIEATACSYQTASDFQTDIASFLGAFQIVAGKKMKFQQSHLLWEPDRESGLWNEYLECTNLKPETKQVQFAGNYKNGAATCSCW